jgi:hypothetical protein
MVVTWVTTLKTSFLFTRNEKLSSQCENRPTWLEGKCLYKYSFVEFVAAKGRPRGLFFWGWEIFPIHR